MPVRRERSRDFWLAFSSVFTKKVPTMEHRIPHTARRMGRIIPSQPYPAQAPREKVARMEPT